MKKTLIASMFVLTITGCATVPAPNQVAGEQVNYPTWYETNATPGENALYAVATEYSRDMQFSVDKATLSAKRQLAANYSSYVTSMMKDYVSEFGNDPELAKDVSRTTKLMVAEVNLVGVQRTNFQVNREGNGYRAFVRLRFPTDETKQTIKNAAAESFEEMQNSSDRINNVQSDKPLGSADPNAPIVSSRFVLSDSPSVDNTPIEIN